MAKNYFEKLVERFENRVFGTQGDEEQTKSSTPRTSEKGQSRGRKLADLTKTTQELARNADDFADLAAKILATQTNAPKKERSSRRISNRTTESTQRSDSVETKGSSHRSSATQPGSKHELSVDAPQMPSIIQQGQTFNTNRTKPGFWSKIKNAISYGWNKFKSFISNISGQNSSGSISRITEEQEGQLSQTNTKSLYPDLNTKIKLHGVEYDIAPYLRPGSDKTSKSADRNKEAQQQINQLTTILSGKNSAAEIKTTLSEIGRIEKQIVGREYTNHLVEQFTLPDIEKRIGQLGQEFKAQQHRNERTSAKQVRVRD